MTRHMQVMVVAVAFICAACSGATIGDSGDATAATSTDQTAADQTAANQTAVAEPAEESVEDGGVAMAASSPIGAFFADDGGFDAALDEYRLQVREAIVVCMAAQGFEFDASAPNNRDAVEERQNDMTRRAWTTEFGFGISTSFDSIAQDRAANPNGAIVRSLGAAERQIWAITLNGVGMEALGEGGNQIGNPRPLEEQGCIGQALIETGGQDAIEGLSDFGDTYDEGEAALFERREMIEAVDAWSRCMGAEGYVGYAALDDPKDDVTERFREITAPIGPALAEMTPEEGQALLSGESLDVDKLPGLDVEALRSLQAAERELALADLGCYEADVQATYEPLLNDFENGLLEDFSNEFAALKDLGR